MNKPIVSIILNTKNEERNIDNILSSIKNQTHKDLEIIVVDNNSVDKTKELAGKYTKNVFNIGPERSTQRNYGAKKAQGEWLLFVDADMILDNKVIEECLETAKKGYDAIVIPERSTGEGFWAAVKGFEKSLYVGDPDIEAPRFIRKTTFEKTDGYDEAMIASEDWDLSDRLKESGAKFGRVSSFINHNEWNLRLSETLSKKYYYGKNIKNFFNKKTSKKNRYSLVRGAYFRNLDKFIKQPVLGIGFIILKTLETLAGGLGYLRSLQK